MKSPADTKNLEKAILSDVLKTLDQKPPKFTRPGWAFWSCTVVGLVLVLSFDWNPFQYLDAAWIRIAGPLVAFIIGAILIYVVQATFIKSQLHFLKPFVDRSAVEARLRELEA